MPRFDRRCSPLEMLSQEFKTVDMHRYSHLASMRIARPSQFGAESSVLRISSRTFKASYGCLIDLRRRPGVRRNRVEGLAIAIRPPAPQPSLGRDRRRR